MKTNTKAAVIANSVNVKKLPEGFDAWAVAQASAATGVSRTVIVKETGQSCKWRGYMAALADKQGYKFTMKTSGTGKPAIFFFTKLAAKAAKKPVPNMPKMAKRRAAAAKQAA